MLKGKSCLSEKLKLLGVFSAFPILDYLEVGTKTGFSNLFRCFSSEFSLDSWNSIDLNLHLFPFQLYQNLIRLTRKKHNFLPAKIILCPNSLQRAFQYLDTFFFRVFTLDQIIIQLFKLFWKLRIRNSNRIKLLTNFDNLDYSQIPNLIQNKIRDKESFFLFLVWFKAPYKVAFWFL